ncbi:SusC/RagA family TonB-linked outer membrane protein [Sphingobacterium sp. LRF_L2]|uniref:SusC/RagA family TonB-linked outer membrane protein n=1 Tax=Sphingobacterium sp. LRF_L2 TaxID=3369421 RepID=UPI003F612F27
MIKNNVNKYIKYVLCGFYMASCYWGGLSRADTLATFSKPFLLQKKQYIASGRIVADNGTPILGVSVTEKGTGNTVMSSSDGTFRLLVASAESVLVFSHIGYLKREFSAHMLTPEITLSPDDSSLEQVVITGYQKINKSRFTGSVSQVGKENIDRSGYVDVSRMLQGAAAGVSVQNVSGTFGATPKIRIRGNASISANQEPLYVLNGVPISSPANVSVSQLYSGDPASLLGSAIAGLNAQDIEDIVILKDGAATSLYGTRAANGVISITTKSGKKNSRNINFSTSITLGIKPSIQNYNVMNSGQEMDFYKELYDLGYFSDNNWPSATGAFTDAYRRYALREIDQQEAYAELDKSAAVNTDWFDVLFRNNILQEHALSFSGGRERYTYHLSGSYANDNGQTIGHNMDRMTTDFRLTSDITSKLHVDLNVNWNHRNQMAPGTFNSGTVYSDVARNFEINPAIYAISTARSMYPYNADGSYKYYLNNYADFNIIEELNENFTALDVNEWRVQLRPSYQLFSNLRYDLTLAARASRSGTDHIITERSNVANAYRVDYNDALREANELLYRDPTDPNAYYESILPEGGFRRTNNYKGRSYNMRHSLNFKDSWGDHLLDITAGFEFNNDRVDRTYQKYIGYMHYSGGTVNTSDLALLQVEQTDEKLYEETFTNQYLLGYYLSTQYSYRERYNVELGGRLDASNMFGKSVRSRFLPNYSFGLSWNVDKESFMQRMLSSAVLQYLKLRGSYALRGNAYQTSPTRNAAYANAVRLDSENSEQVIDILSPELYSLTWEKDFIANVGLELGLWNKIDLALDVYDRKNKDLISSSTVALEQGFGTKVINFATMQNRGFDITLGLKNLAGSPDWNWSMQAVYGYVQNKVIGGELKSSLLTQITRSTGYPLDGYPLEGLFGYNYTSLDSEGRPVFSNAGRDAQGITSSATDRNLVSYVGSRQPIGTGSISQNIGYKGLELRVMFTFAYGHKVFMSPIASRTYTDYAATSGDLAYRWMGPGDEAYTNVPGLLSSIQRLYLSTVSNMDELAYNRSNLRVADASTIRLSELMISYELAPHLLDRLGKIKRARVSFSGNNLKYWASKKLKGVDPDLLLTGTALPNPVSYSFRIVAGF